MKKVWATVLAWVMLLSLLPTSAFASGETASGTCGAEGDNLTWTLDAEGTLTVSGEGDMADFDNSDPWADYRVLVKKAIVNDGVTSLGASAFRDCKNLESVRLPDTLRVIDADAFVDCVKLTDVALPGSLSETGGALFVRCTSLTEVTLPEGLRYIGWRLFYGCTALQKVTIPVSVTTIGKEAFFGCTALTDVCYGGPEYVWNGVAIEDGNAALTDAAIHFGKDLIVASGTCGAEGDNLTWTLDAEGTLTVSGEGDMANFYGETPWGDYWLSIKKLVVQEGVTSIGAFSGCSNLASVWLPGTLTTINSGAFFECTSLQNIDLPDSLTDIGPDAFVRCTSMSEITLPNGLNYIGGYAFSGCTALQKVTIPASVTTIAANAFSGCTALTDVYYTGPEYAWNGVTIEGGDLALTNATIHFGKGIAVSGTCGAEGDNLTWTLDAEGTLTVSGEGYMTHFFENDLWANYRTLIRKAVINEGVTSLGASAFYNCKNLESVRLPDTLRVIYGDAFSDCIRLTDVALPGSLSATGGAVFLGCTSLTEITLPEGLRYIGWHLFYGCTALQKVTIPVSVTTIQEEAFSGCTSLAEVRYDGAEDMWQQVQIGAGNESLLSAALVYGVAGNEGLFSIADATLQAVTVDGTVATIPVTGGKYTLDDLAAGIYTIRAEKAGFVPYEREFVYTGANRPPDVQLVQIGNVNGVASAVGGVDAADMQCLFELLSTGTYTGTIRDEGYRSAVADVNNDGSMNILDYQALYEMTRS